MTVHYLTSATLRRDASAMSLIELLSPHDHGKALNTQHKLIWSLFASEENSSAKRDFIWREDNNNFLILSEQIPKDSHNLFDMKTTRFEPNLKKNSTCRFRLRSNATICRTVNVGSKRVQKRHDVVMDQIHKLEKASSEFSRSQLREQAITSASEAWLNRIGDRAGFVPKELINAQYTTVQIPRNKGKKAHLGILEIEGVLNVKTPDLLLSSIVAGFGRAKAFGCGLMLVMPI